MSANAKDVKTQSSQDEWKPDQMTATGQNEEKLNREPPQNDDADGSPEARLDANVQAHLGRKLKAAYKALVDEPVPNKFRKLLDELESKESKT